jgi:hypothetical protein
MQITVHYLFSKNNKIGSKIIRWGTAFLEPWVEEEDVSSHTAVLLNEKWVVESTLDKGVRVISYKEWKKINIEIIKIKCYQNRNMEEIKNFYKPLKDKKYDWPGVIYFSYRIALKKMFNIDIPEKNKWNSNSKYFCSEVVGKMTNTSYEMTAPIQIMGNILKFNGINR